MEYFDPSERFKTQTSIALKSHFFDQSKTFGPDQARIMRTRIETIGKEKIFEDKKFMDTVNGLRT